MLPSMMHRGIGGKGDPIVWVGLASCSGALATGAPLPTLGAVIVLGALLFVRARWTAMLAAIVFLLGLARASLAIHGHEQRRSAVIEAGGWPARCTLRGRVVRTPTLVGGSLRVEVESGEIRCRDGPSLGGKATVHVPVDVATTAAPMMALARGDEVFATASLAPPYRFWNDGVGDPRPTSARRDLVLSGGAEDLVVLREGRGVLPGIDRMRARVRQRIDATFPPETSPMARALVLGEDDLAEEDQRAFRKSGLAHLLAVSGMHLVLVVMGFVAAARAALVRVSVLSARFDVARVASGLGLPVAWMYAELAGGSGSAVRAAWMCTVVLLAGVLARRSSAWRGLGLSMLAMSIVDPLVVFDVSFVLSALATLGILALAAPLEEGMRRCARTWTPRVTLPAFIIKPLATTGAATIACSPVLATMAPELPVGGLVANVIAVPLGEAAALPLCLGHCLLAVWPSAESGCAVAASGALTLVRIVARAFTWATVPVPPPTAAQLAVMACVAGAIALGRPRVWLGLGAIAVAGIEVVTRIQGMPHNALRVTFLDVGQGDAALVDLPDGSTMLVDGGGLVGSPIDVGERVVAPLLAARRRGALDVVVLSHPHPDHFLGLSSALARVRVHSFWDTGQGESEGAGGRYGELIANVRARGVRVVHPSELCGSHAIGGAVVEVLAPCPGPELDRGANDNSFVLRVRFGARAVLLVGDAEHEEESRLVRVRGREGLRADVLKVGHHGSRTSSTADFVSTVSPSIAVISCGVRNRFGHPHPQTVDTLTRSGAHVLRTDRRGSVIVTTDGRSLDVRTMDGPP